MRVSSGYTVVVLVSVLVSVNAWAGNEEGEENTREAVTVPVYFSSTQLILVKDFSMENVEVEVQPKNKAKVVAAKNEGTDVAAKKKKRLPPVLSGKLQMRLLRHGFSTATYSSNSSGSGALVIDGEFVRIHKKKPRMTVRVWVYHTDTPSKRIIQTEVSARSTAGPVAIGSVAMNNLAHNVTAYLLVSLPSILQEMK